MTTTTFETVKSPEQMKQSQQQSAAAASAARWRADDGQKGQPQAALDRLHDESRVRCRSKPAATEAEVDDAGGLQRKEVERGHGEELESTETSLMADRTSRRKFLKAVPTAVAGAVAAKAYAQAPAQNAGPVTSEIIRAAEMIDGVKFTSEEAAAAAQCGQQQPRRVQPAPADRHPAGHRARVHLQALVAGQGTKGPGDARRARQIHKAAAHAEAAGQSRGRRVLAGHAAGGARRAQAGDSDRAHEHVPRAAEAVSAVAEFLRDSHRRPRAEAGGRRRPRDQGREVPRPAPRDPVGREGSVRDERDQDDVGR